MAAMLNTMMRTHKRTAAVYCADITITKFPESVRHTTLVLKGVGVSIAIQPLLDNFLPKAVVDHGDPMHTPWVVDVIVVTSGIVLCAPVVCKQQIAQSAAASLAFALRSIMRDIPQTATSPSSHLQRHW